MNKMWAQLISAMVRDRNKRHAVRDILKNKETHSPQEICSGPDDNVRTRAMIRDMLSIYSGLLFREYKDKQELYLNAAKKFPLQLKSLITQNANEQTIRSNVPFVDSVAYGAGYDSSILEKLFNEHGSDKGRGGYHYVYSRILTPAFLKDNFTLLEIGLGSGNWNMPFWMGPKAVPGASLRAFRDYLPNARIFGADLDKEILFQEERIRTAFIDQTDISAFDEMTLVFGQSTFDVIIDDGLHMPFSNINTVLFGLNHVNSNGYIVIEDIYENDLLFWDIVYNLIDKNRFEMQRIGGLILMQKLS